MSLSHLPDGILNRLFQVLIVVVVIGVILKALDG